MARDLMIPAHSVASLLARIFGPAIYDAPPFGGWYGAAIDPARGPHPDPWRARALNPQPLPPGERHALALADAHIQEVLALERLGTLLGEEAARRAEARAAKLISQVEELCPRLPPWPKGWPPLPTPPGEREEMTSNELFLFGTRVLAASEVFEQGRVRDALAGLAEKALGLSLGG